MLKKEHSFVGICVGMVTFRSVSVASWYALSMQLCNVNQWVIHATGERLTLVCILPHQPCYYIIR